MKKQILFAALIFLSLFANAQNLPQCDSLVINCCTFDSLGPNTLTIYVSNPSTVLFDYPGFVLFDAAMDTIAKETVNYFGISAGPQPHTMNIVSTLILPFNGFLNLYTQFYNTLACSFPFSIPDTTNGISEAAATRALKVFPNPSVNEVAVELNGFSAGSNLSLVIYNALGKEIFRTAYDHSPLKISLQEMNAGIYFIRITDAENKLHGSQKIMVLGKEKF